MIQNKGKTAFKRFIVQGMEKPDNLVTFHVIIFLVEAFHKKMFKVLAICIN